MPALLQMAATGGFVPRGIPVTSYISERLLQDHQVGLTSAPFRLLPLHWVLEHIRVCVHPLRVKSFLQSSGSSNTSPCGLQSQLFSEVVFPVQDTQTGEPDVGLGPPHSLGRTSEIVIILLFVNCQPRVIGLDDTTSLLLLTILLWFLLYVFSCGNFFC